MSYHVYSKKCDGNCDWCDCPESTRLPMYFGEFELPLEFGCLYPDKCCMPGLHMRSECHTAEDYETEHSTPHTDYPCRNDGRCQYAIDHGAEGLGHCPKGKCAMNPEK